MVKHPEKALTSVRVKNISSPGRYADGNGLYLVVDPTGAKRWVLRTVVHGRRRDIGLGGVRLVSLAEAREEAAKLRRVARDGGDPLQEKRRARAVIPTFEDAARRTHKEHKNGWKNKKHASQWINTLQQFAFPTIGKMRVDHIETPDILRALAPIWLTKPETARRVKQRVGTVFDWAKAAGFRSGENPVQGIAKGLPKQSARPTHFSALPYASVPLFVKKLRASASSEAAKLAFEFLVLVAARTTEVLHARWSEIAVESALWTIPASSDVLPVIPAIDKLGPSMEMDHAAQPFH
jgi:hypothetical protein